MRKVILYIVFLFFLQTGFAVENIDSLQNAVQLAQGDSAKATAYFNLATAYDDGNKLKQEYLDVASSLAKKKNLKSLIGSIYYETGKINFHAQNYDEAARFFMRSAIMLKEQGKISQAAMAYREHANCLLRQNDYSKALESYNKSIDMAKSNSDSVYMAKVYADIGVLLVNNMSKPLEGLSYHFKAKKILENSLDKVELAWTLNKIGNAYIELGNYMEAHNFYLQALNLHEINSDLRGISAAYNNMGEVFRYQGNLSSALENYLKSLKIAEQTNDNVSKGIFLSNIGIIYYEQDNYIEAKDFFNKAIEIGESDNQKRMLVEAYVYMGLTYKKQRKFDEAMKYFNHAIQLADEQGNIQKKAFVLNAIGELNIEKKFYDSALVSFKKALELEKSVNDRNGIVNTMIGLGKLHMETNAINQAVKNLKEGLYLANEIGVKPQEAIIYELLSIAFEKTNNFEEAYKYYKLYTVLNNELNSFKEIQKMESIEAQYKAETREKELELLRKERELSRAELERKKAEINQQKTQQFATIIGLVLSLLLGVIVFIGYTERRKAFKKLAVQNAEIERKNTDITSSIQYSKKIQEAYLPTNEIVSKYLDEYFVYYQPKDIVSGDFYWIGKAADNSIVIAVADCTGHGVPGAFMSVIGISALNDIVLTNKTSKADSILNKLNEYIISSLKQGDEISENHDGMDLTLVVLNPDTGELVFAGANNPLFVIKQNGEFIEIKGDKQPIGFHYNKQIAFTANTIKLDKGDTIYLCTDGIFDQFGGPNNKKYMVHNYKKFLQKISHLPLAQQRERIEEEFLTWKGDSFQVDDICIMGFRV